MANRHEKRKTGDDAGVTDGPERQCAVTRACHAPDDLIRFVLDPSGTLVPDLDRKLPGRGAWLTATREIVEKAIKTKALSRSLKADAKTPADLGERIDRMLARRAADTLSLANKAGLAVAGFQQVDSALDKAQIAVLLHGQDAARDGCHKLDRKFEAIQRALGRTAPVVTVLTINEISLAMGRPSVVHAALIPGGLTERFLREAGRLARYRTSSAASEFPRSPDSGDAETPIEG